MLIALTLECLKASGKYLCFRQLVNILDKGFLIYGSSILYTEPGMLSIPGAPWGGFLWTAFVYSDSVMSTIVSSVSYIAF